MRREKKWKIGRSCNMHKNVAESQTPPFKALTKEYAALKSSSEQGPLVPVLISHLFCMFDAWGIMQRDWAFVRHKACDFLCLYMHEVCCFVEILQKNLAVNSKVINMVYNYWGLAQYHLISAVVWCRYLDTYFGRELNHLLWFLFGQLSFLQAWCMRICIQKLFSL